MLEGRTEVGDAEVDCAGLNKSHQSYSHERSLTARDQNAEREPSRTMEACLCNRPDIHSVAGASCCLSCGYYSAAQEEIRSTPLSERAKYHYRPLQSTNSIRLVRLYGGHRDDGIQCQIFHTTLDAHEHFEALSYTWGDSTLSKSILTTEGRLPVTANCFAALQDLRYQTDERILWIDAICICQRNTSEKNHQVPLMNTIYKEAMGVLIHINPDYGTYPLLPERVFRLFDQHSNLLMRFARQYEISNFLSQPWWSRVWILQEVAVARKALLVWGSTTLDWDHFTVAQLVARDFQPYDNQGNVPPVLLLSRNDPKPLKDFVSLMQTARCCKSSDPRDKIYALLGLLDSNVAHNLVADYNKSEQAVYADFVSNYVAAYNNLDILCLLGRESDVERRVSDIERTRYGELKGTWEMAQTLYGSGEVDEVLGSGEEELRNQVHSSLSPQLSSLPKLAPLHLSLIHI